MSQFPSWLVIANPSDPAAPWLAAGLVRRGFAGLRLVSVDALAYSTSIVHEVSASNVSTAITLYDGTVVGPDLRGCVNRTTYLPLRHLDAAPEPDRGYATQELYALFTSILHGLPGTVLNRASGRGLCGPALAPTEWAVAAGAAGLAVEPVRSPLGDGGSRDADGPGRECAAFVVGDRVLGPVGHHGSAGRVPSAVADGLRRLAGSIGVDVLGARFVVGEDWVFVGASSAPDLRPGGEELLDAVAVALR